MNHKNILTRAWGILWSYKTLWVFGVILALTTSTFTDRVFQSSSNTQNLRENPPAYFGQSFQEGMEELREAIDELSITLIPKEFNQAIISVAILLGCFIIILIILGLFLRYISETAIIKLVDDFESTGNKKSWRQGFQIGWSRSAWKLFLIDLTINLPLILIFTLLVVFGLIPLVTWTSGNPVAGIFGSVLAIGLFTLVIFLGIIIFALLSLLKHFFRRACVLNDYGVFESITQGFSLVQRNLKDVIMMWLIIIGIQIGYGILMIPIFLIMLVSAGLIGGLFGLSVGGITGLIMNGGIPIISGVVVGITIFFIVLITPIAFFSGLKETYTSTSWTLTYREIQLLGNLETDFSTQGTTMSEGETPNIEVIPPSQ
jgi:hypothetical protein